MNLIQLANEPPPWCPFCGEPMAADPHKKWYCMDASCLGYPNDVQAGGPEPGWREVMCCECGQRLPREADGSFEPYAPDSPAHDPAIVALEQEIRKQATGLPSYVQWLAEAMLEWADTIARRLGLEEKR